MTKIIDESIVDNMDALCPKGREQVKELLRALRHLEQPKGEARWRNQGGVYHMISYSGDVFRFWDGSDKHDNEYYQAGNYFRTEEIAKKYAKHRAARQRLEMLALELNGEDFPLVPPIYSQAYYILRENDMLWIEDYKCSRDGTIYFRTKELARQALDLTSDEDLIELFGISDKGNIND